MASSSGIVFLESSLDDRAKNLGQYKPGNTDVIRTMLREQQKECQQLHQNALFREFRDEGQKQKKFGKGNPVDPNGGAPNIDDFQAEGQTRMFELIKSSAVKEEKPLRGVWASFGKPYVCLGDPSEPNNSLPKLYRDELAKQDAKQKGGMKKSKSAAANTQQQQQQQSNNPATGSPKRGGLSAGTMKSEGMEESTLMKNKTVLRFDNRDLLEAKFPEPPLRMASDRRFKSMVRPGAFLSDADAESEMTDPYKAYGQPPLPIKRLVPINQKGRKAEEEEEGDAKSQVFITQGTGNNAAEDGAQYGADGRRSNATGRASVAGSLFMRGGDGASEAGDNDQSGQDTGSGRDFQPLGEPAIPGPGDETNPVYGWHNKFVEVRLKGRNQLQHALYIRSEGRFRARTTAPMTANLSSILMADLEVLRGKKVPYVHLGREPPSPYVKMEANWAAQEESRRIRTAKAQTLDPEELRALQRFYDQLCALVEAQRMSDPLSLMVIHKVKGLLEVGTFLHKAMLVAVLDHIGSFVRGCGLAAKHNKYVLAPLTFISKCVNVSDAEFEDLVTEHGLVQVVYGSMVTPSRAAAEAEAARAAAASGHAGGAGARGAKKGSKAGPTSTAGNSQAQLSPSPVPHGEGISEGGADGTGGGAAEGEGTGAEGGDGAEGHVGVEASMADLHV